VSAAIPACNDGQWIDGAYLSHAGVHLAAALTLARHLRLQPFVSQATSFVPAKVSGGTSAGLTMHVD
jgi:hypothetical protein